MRLAEIKPGLALVGLEPERVCTVVAVTPIADNATQVVYKLPDGALKERLLGPTDEPTISIATTERPWAFDGDGADFQLACEAKRIDLAFLFDPMMAVHTSNVEPLPHQITAVYESMLPRQPLRYVLADDPGAGKTIMAGLYIRELIMRADARRVLIVAPGGLVEQWRDELFEKFGLEFRVYTGALEDAAPTGNPFEDHHQLIVRLDQMSRNEDLQAKLCAAGWDLVVFDEAHKLAAHFFGAKLEKTGRFRFAEELGKATRHLLLMTATPHNGKEEDFQLFLSLLDSDRFYGRFRDGVHKVDVTDLMRRMVKEELVKFDGTPLFPERKAYTVNYTLSNGEAALYEAVTEYVQAEMGKADELDGKRRGSVGFALTSLQRRLASSPEAIYQSLRRRKERLSERLREERLGIRGRQVLAEVLDDIPEDDDDLNANEQENLEERLVDQASAARSIAELEAEITILTELEKQAKAVVGSGQDRKWDELSKLLQNTPEMHDESGRQRKIIIFSEHRDTLNYLHARIAGVLGTPEAIVTIHGGTHRDERKKAQALFRSDKDTRVLIATDAAGEGVNLQCASLMVNYDLPWNPNRLEQRFGRIHRIGQTEVCHLWSLVAKETREGSVWHRLLEKLATECAALKGNLVVGGNGFVGIFVRDRLLGTTERVSISSAGTQATANCEYPSISADGRFVAFDSVASTLVTGDTNGLSDVFVRDRQLGTTERASVGAAGVESDGDSSSASLSGDGRFVAFASDAMNLVPGVTIGWIHIYIYDRQTSLTQIVSVDSLGVHANSYSGWPSISADGRFVAFSSIATNLVPADLNNKRDVFLHDMQTGATILESSSSSGVQGNGDSGYLYNYSLPTDGRPAISADGLRVAFESVASNLVFADTNVVADGFLSDRTCAGSVFTYCTAKTNSLGCVPSIGSSGLPTQSGSDNFYVTASNVLNNKLGMMLWSLGPANNPFFGGTLCLQQPIVRTPALTSGGSSMGSDCTGSYAFHFTQAYMQQHLLSVGTVIYAQYWSRDPGFAIPNNIGLTDGLQFTICP